jgi:hypothetical protein
MRVLWRGAKETATFYRFWRVRLALHVTAKGIYIPGFCTSTFIYTFIHFLIYIYIYIHTYIFNIYINSIHSCTSVITSYHLHTCNRLLLHLIIVYLFLVYVLLLLYVYICVYFLLYCLVSWYRSCRVFFWLRSAPL